MPGKTEALYRYITSDDFRRAISEASDISESLGTLDAEEVKRHQVVWSTRGAMISRVRNICRAIDAEIMAIVEAPTNVEIQLFKAG